MLTESRFYGHFYNIFIFGIYEKINQARQDPAHMKTASRLSRAFFVHMRPGRMIFWYIHDNRYVCAKPYKQLSIFWEPALNTLFQQQQQQYKKGEKIADATISMNK